MCHVCRSIEITKPLAICKVKVCLTVNRCQYSLFHCVYVGKFFKVYVELEAIGAASAESRARRILAVSYDMKFTKHTC